MSGPTLFTLGDTAISLAGTSASIGGMTSVGTSIITAINNDSLTLNSGTSHHFITNGTEKMTITPGGNVGVGIAEPTTTLHLKNGTIETVVNCNTGIARAVIGTVSNHKVYLLSNSPHTHVNIVAQTNGHVSIRGDIANIHAMFVNGGVEASVFTTTSDDRIKYNEETISGVSSLVMINELQPRYYEKLLEIPKGATGTWIPTDAEWPSVKDNYNWRNEAGLIAQDVRAIPGLSFAVSGEEVDAEGTQMPLSLEYNDIHAYHIAATKELSSQLNDEKAKVADLLARVTALENP